MIWLVGSLVGIGLVLCAQALLGARLRGPAGSFMILQCFYISMAWLVRPLVLLVVQPSPRRDDQIADPRFAWLGYDVRRPLHTLAARLAGLGELLCRLFRLPQPRAHVDVGGEHADCRDHRSVDDGLDISVRVDRAPGERNSRDPLDAGRGGCGRVHLLWPERSGEPEKVCSAWPWWLAVSSTGR